MPKIRLEYVLVCGQFDAGSPCELGENDYTLEISGIRSRTVAANRLKMIARARQYVQLLKKRPQEAIQDFASCRRYHHGCQNCHALWSYKILEVPDGYMDPTILEEWTFETDHPLSDVAAKVRVHLKELEFLQGPPVEVAKQRLEAFLLEYLRLRLRQAIDDDTAALEEWLPDIEAAWQEGAVMLAGVAEAIGKVYANPGDLAARLAADLRLGDQPALPE